MQATQFTVERLQEAVDVRQKIDALQLRLSSLLGEVGTKLRGPSMEGRKKIAAAQKARWAKIHAEQKHASKAA